MHFLMCERGEGFHEEANHRCFISEDSFPVLCRPAFACELWSNVKLAVELSKLGSGHCTFHYCDIAVSDLPSEIPDCFRIDALSEAINFATLQEESRRQASRL
jgi:hypothetical protein